MTFLCYSFLLSSTNIIVSFVSPFTSILCSIFPHDFCLQIFFFFFYLITSVSYFSNLLDTLPFTSIVFNRFWLYRHLFLRRKSCKYPISSYHITHARTYDLFHLTTLSYHVIIHHSIRSRYIPLIL